MATLIMCEPGSEGHVWTHVTSHLARYAKYVTGLTGPILLLRLSPCMLPLDQGYCNCSFPSSWIDLPRQQSNVPMTYANGVKC